MNAHQAAVAIVNDALSIVLVQAYGFLPRQARLDIAEHVCAEAEEWRATHADACPARWEDPSGRLHCGCAGGTR